MAKNKSNKIKSKDLSALGGLVYSTDPNFHAVEDKNVTEVLAANQMLLYVSRDKKGRGGKVATLIEGFEGYDATLNELCKMLKQKCGVGGTTKDGEIIIQGDKRDKVAQILKEEGYRIKLKGG